MRGLGGAAHALLQQAKLALGVVAKEPGSGTANTALVYHARRLMALHEGDLPYAVRLACLRGLETHEVFALGNSVHQKR